MPRGIRADAQKYLERRRKARLPKLNDMKTVVIVDGKPVERLEPMLTPAQISAILATTSTCFDSENIIPETAENKISTSTIISPGFFDVGGDWPIQLDPHVS